jgi:tetratricopeptide (TPR) repeat protein
MSSVEVISGIFTVIGIIETSIKLFRSVKKLSYASRSVGTRLPIVRDSLKICADQLEPMKDSLPSEACETIAKTLDTCSENAVKLRDIFEDVTHGNNVSGEEENLQCVQKENKLEELIVSIVQDVQLIANNHAVKSAKSEKFSELDIILKEIHSKKRNQGPDHTCTRDVVHRLGNVYANQGKLEEAEELYRRALAGNEKNLGPDHTSTLATVHKLGNLYADQGKLEEAEELYQRALAGKEKNLGPDHTSALDTVQRLGNLYADQGKLAEAEESHQRATISDQARPVELFSEADRPDGDSDTHSSVSDVASIFSPTTSPMSSSTETILCAGPLEDARRTAPEYLAHILSCDPVLHQLYVQSLQKFGSNRFSKKHIQLLRRFFAELRLETTDNTLLGFIRFLQSRSQREEATQKICELLQSGQSFGEGRLFSRRRDDRETPSEEALKPDLGIEDVAQMPMGGRERRAGENIDEGEGANEGEEDDEYDDEGEDEDDSIDEEQIQHLGSAIVFLTKGLPFENFKSRFAHFANTPTTIREAVASKDIDIITQLLERNFDLVAKGDNCWLRDLDKLGYSRKQIADILLEQSEEGPWLLDQLPSSTDGPLARKGYHLPGCIHQLSQETSLKSSSNLLHHQQSVPPNDLRIQIQGLCGLGGVIPVSTDPDDWEGTISVESKRSMVSYMRISEQANAGNTNVITKAFERARNAVERALRALGCVQQEGLCCDSFTVLVRDRDTKSNNPILRLIRMEIKPALKLYNILSRLSREYQSIEELSQILMCEQSGLYDCNKRILRPFQASAAISPAEEQVTSILQFCALSVQFFSLGLLSYTQGHCGVLRPIFIDRSLECITLCGTGVPNAPTVTCSLVRASCLDIMLEGPVLAFSMSSSNMLQHDADSPKIVDDEMERLDVLTTSVDLIDTWGPAKILSPATRPSPTAVAIFIRGGITSLVGTRSDKPLLHWWRGADLGKLENCKDFNIRELVLVGGPLEVNHNCIIQVDNDPEITCEVLGPYESYWRLATRAFAVAGGVAFKGTLNVQASQGWTKEEECSIKKDFQANPEKYQIHWLLDNPWAVQISLCTGAAQRVKLRELVADLLPISVEGQWNPPEEWDELRDHRQIIAALRFANLQQWGTNLPRKLRQTVESLVRGLLLALVPTGLDRKGNLVICWPSRNGLTTCIKVPHQRENHWTRILADSAKIATFAYMTPRCLEATHLRCQNLSAYGGNAGSLLGTAVCLDIPSRGDSAAADERTLQQSKSYWIGRDDHPVLVKAECPDNDYPRLWVIPNSIPENIVRHFLRRSLLKLRERHLDSIQGELVLIQEGIFEPNPKTSHIR